MKPALALLTALVLVGLTAPASAQMSMMPTRVQVDIDPFEEVLSEHGRLQTTVHVEYMYYFAGSLALANTQVDLHVVEAPEGVNAVLSPSTVFFSHDATPGGQMVSAGTHSVDLMVSANESAQVGDSDIIRVVAIARPNDPLEGSSGSAETLVEIGEHECEESATPQSGSDGQAASVDADTASADPAAGDTTDLETSSAGAPAPLVSTATAAVLALGLAGAGAGTFIAYRRRR